MIIGPLKINFSEIFNQNATLFIHENIFQNVARTVLGSVFRYCCVSPVYNMTYLEIIAEYIKNCHGAYNNQHSFGLLILLLTYRG